MNIEHPYCKGDSLLPTAYKQLSVMPCSFGNSWPLTLEVLFKNDGPDMRCIAPEACEYVEKAHAAWERAHD